MPGMGPGMGQPFVPPPPIPLPAEPPSLEFQKSALDFFSWWGQASYDYMKADKDRRDLLRDLLQSQRLLSQWNLSRDQIDNDIKKAACNDAKRDGDEEVDADSDFVISISPIVQTLNNKAHRICFASDPFFSVEMEDPTNSVDDSGFSTCDKFQWLLGSKLNQGHFDTSVFMAWTNNLLFGYCVGKIHYYTRAFPQRVFNPMTGQIMMTSNTVADFPLLEVVDPDEILLDWEAKDADVQRHHGIGHRIDMPVHRAKERFAQGIFNLNQDEFLRRWGQMQGASWNLRTEGWQNAQVQSRMINARMPILKAWEFHGLIPNEQGLYVEGLLTVLTERSAETPAGGLLVRLQEGTALPSGERPFAMSHYTPMPKATGQGVIEPNLDLIYYLSQLVNLYIDCIRYSVNPMIIGDAAFKQQCDLAPEGNLFYPGKVWGATDPSNIKPFQIPLQNAQHLVQLIQYFDSMLEKRTGVSDTTLGVGQREKTATESHILADAVSLPLAVRCRTFAQTFLEPVLNMSLALMQQFSPPGQTVSLKGGDGIEQRIPITPQEMRTGKYIVKALLDNQDQTRLAKAQSIERIIPVLNQTAQKLMEENTELRLTPLIEEYLNCMRAEISKQVLIPLTPERAQQLQIQQMLQLMQQQAGQGQGQPPGNGNGQAKQPHQLVRNGGPQGQQPTDTNAMAQLFQLMAQNNSGLQGPIQ